MCLQKVLAKDVKRLERKLHSQAAAATTAETQAQTREYVLVHSLQEAEAELRALAEAKEGALQFAEQAMNLQGETVGVVPVQQQQGLERVMRVCALFVADDNAHHILTCIHANG